MRNLFIPNKKNSFKPYLLRKPALALYTVALLLINMFGGLLGIPEAMASSITSANVIALTNQERAAAGLNTLNTDSRLTAAAQAKANNMFQEQYWDHFGPNGESPWMFITQAGYQYVYAGENLAKGFQTAEGVHEAWMASPTHRDNIVSKNYKDIGVAVVSGVLLGKETILVVQMFGNLTDQVQSVKSTIPPSTTTKTPKATVVDSGQIKSIKITNPKTGDVIKDANIDVTGETGNISGEYTVEILEESQVVGETKSNTSSWTFDKQINWEEGDHKLVAQVKGTDTKSDEVSFKIDSTAPQIDKSSITVNHTEQEYELSFSISEDVTDINLVSGDQTYHIDKGEDGNARLTISKDILGERTILMLSDSAGNISEIDISEYFLEGDSQETSNNILLWLKNTFTTTDGISLAIVSFIFLLLTIEVIVYWKKGTLGKHSGELFTIGAWWLIILVGIFKGFGGIIN